MKVKYHKFQFQYGTIKSPDGFSCITFKNRFNSNMVRLKESIHLNFLNVTSFQFQYGTIKRINTMTVACYNDTFQFQYGTIKSWGVPERRLAENLFQFQYGTIKRNTR